MRWWMLTIIWVLAGCSVNYGPLYPDQPLAAFADAREGRVQEGALARWEGLIASVQNLPRRTRIEVAYMPLDRQGRPSGVHSPGRFVAYVDEFLDPLIYAHGRSITLLGTVAPPESGRVGEYELSLPVLQASEHKLWEKVREVEIRYVEPWFYHDPFHRW